jgi:hypothetical protein
MYMRLRKNEGMLQICTNFLPNLQVLCQDQCLLLHILTAPASCFVTFNRPEQFDLYDKIQTGNNNVRSMEHQAVKPG